MLISLDSLSEIFYL